MLIILYQAKELELYGGDRIDKKIEVEMKEEIR